MPDVIAKLVKQGVAVAIESGAGAFAQATDDAYRAGGATLFSASERSAHLAKADLVLTVQALPASEMAALKKEAITISFLPLTQSDDVIAASAKAGVTSFSMELIPRISRAQSMDALTSQALCAGYRAALVGADLSPRFFPLLMTAAGTVTPAQVLVLGAGVAGLQAIATARRLGAVVSAYDVRPSSADEVRSMGATFIELELESLEGAGGYAREMTEERAAKQRELLTPYISKSHVVITTAAVPNRRAPLLVTKEMYSGMVAGSVIVDLAAESGGNVEGSVAGEVIETSAGVRIWGGKDVPSQLPFHASSLYSKNLVNLMGLMIKSGEADSKATIALDFEDEIIAASAVTHAGEIRNEQARAHIQGEKAGKSS
ncbi:MAG: NAD(P)(+) transhydrogenase (Re/Si-specific) subunit alpha [Actinobacteria bacterium]|nr:NAD(P)(+) transhydrogenase (Re/Si-specific) subunit alpha [Actinomycetota bacterium]